MAHMSVEWFRTSITGLILTGALGSLAALLILWLLKLFGKKLLHRLGFRRLIPNVFKPLILATVLTKKYVNRSESTKLMVLACLIVGSFLLSTGLLILTVLATIVYLVFTGTRLTGLSFTLVSLSGLLLLRLA